MTEVIDDQRVLFQILFLLVLNCPIERFLVDVLAISGNSTDSLPNGLCLPIDREETTENHRIIQKFFVLSGANLTVPSIHAPSEPPTTSPQTLSNIVDDGA